MHPLVSEVYMVLLPLAISLNLGCFHFISMSSPYSTGSELFYSSLLHILVEPSLVQMFSSIVPILSAAINLDYELGSLPHSGFICRDHLHRSGLSIYFL